LTSPASLPANQNLLIANGNCKGYVQFAFYKRAEKSTRRTEW
jgi:hypothetical protein